MQVLLAPGATMKILNFRCVDEIDDGLRIKMAKNFETGWGAGLGSLRLLNLLFTPPSSLSGKRSKRDTTADMH